MRSEVHHVAGVIIRDTAGKILLFDRTRQPLGWTVPAGHIEPGEDSAVAAVRELWEETGIVVQAYDLQALGDDVIQGDLCRRGTPTHRWFSFAVQLPGPFSVALCDEGSEFRWVLPAEVVTLPLTHATRYVLERYMF